MTAKISKKVCLLGDFSVGKTSLIRRFVERKFSENYLSTVGVTISKKTVEFLHNSQDIPISIQLLIWDLAGNTRFKSILPSYLNGSSGAVVVGDVTRQATIDHIVNHVELFLSINPQGYIIVALNKSDLLNRDQIFNQISDMSLTTFTQVLGIYQTSAKNGWEVDELFHKLAQKMYKSQ
ncbi:MAG TPA: GTP-binding protein [Cyanobacteria bacterium UBA11149]|nr:GTP-binding protein [Cyanobacteria bacterium UBA11367]HBE57062.1 GTP-binding protein [Cyanobacteria bacterium UBA11366]HBK65687.1 GTP-binding protein [Cyanobacteria bacterium UBA11166]HBR76296.1 GTP-binding protein [Cyanobacteria bacterium UBA11159]HBS72639.1 GTP-binding protein [Cyanobacteria bacterium UBA11153]HBW91729.1 GTP-binding protein [Cyanobacteria bacterium UBA11149]HCA97327.1 GTP-binding protein [Cyanobacteria bacterium UBA9226]